ncbi:MAG: hypothetical protein ACKVIX_00230, partial [Sphingomonadales bacterium]
MMGIRLNKGIDRQEYREINGLNLEDIISFEAVNDLGKKGFLDLSQTHLRATKKGMPLLNSILKVLLV